MKSNVIPMPKKEKPIELNCEQCTLALKVLYEIQGGLYCEECVKIIERMVAVQELDND
jgi:hypothetical protein